MIMNVFDTLDFERLKGEPIVITCVIVYIVVTYVFLLNMLIAQLACSYGSTYQDMVGFARLRRIKLIVETMPSVSAKNWTKFLNGMKLDERLEFNEGDVGLAGGIQVTEPSSANVTTVDMIRRFGGSTSPNMQWPEEDMTGNDAEDRFDKIEKLIEKAMKRAYSGKGHKGGGQGGVVGSSLGQGTGTGSSNTGEKEDEHSESS